MRLKPSASLLAVAAMFAAGTLAKAGSVADSKGFEAIGGYTAGGASLKDQPSGGPLFWEPDILPAGNGIPATVVAAPGAVTIAPGSGVVTGANVVHMVRSSSNVDTRWAPEPASPAPAIDITPLPNNATNESRIVVKWDEYAPGPYPQTGSAGTPPPPVGTNTIMGVEVNDFANSKLVGFVGIDVATGGVIDAQGGTGNEQPVVAPTYVPDAWNNFQFIADYSAQTYSLFVNGALADTQAFSDPSITGFTDASLVSYANASPDGTAGNAYFDNYSVTLIPEPSLAGLSIFSGCALLVMRRPRRSRAV